MYFHRRPSPLLRSAVGRPLALLLAVGMLAAMLGSLPGVATASVAPAHRSHWFPPVLGARMTLGQAPRSLQVAVRRALDRPAVGAGGFHQRAELTASDGAGGDELGGSVAVSGGTAVVGAPYKSSNTGAAYVFVRSGTTWTQQAELTASDGLSGDYFGFSVAVSGGTAVVGAFGHSSYTYTGAAYVFARSGTTWTQQAELTDPDGVASDEFGASVAVSGGTAVIGAPGHGSFAGAAYVFARSGTSWTRQAELTASDGAPNDSFGVSVAVSGGTAVVGAPYKSSSTGAAAYVFVRSGTSWVQQAELTASDGAQNDAFGYSVAVSGGTAVVGAYNHGSSLGATGAAYVFARSGTSWAQQAELAASDGAQGDYFGFSVALSGGTAVVGAQNHFGNTGAAYVFARSGTSWAQHAELTASDHAPNDFFGFSVALSSGTAVVGAPCHGHTPYPGSCIGAAYVFTMSEE